MEAVILAGARRPDDPVAQAGGKSCKALIEIAGRPMIEHVIQALEDSGEISRIHLLMEPTVPVAGEAPDLAARLERGEIGRLPVAASPARSVTAALEALAAAGERPVLVTTADHPLLTAEMVRDFVAGARAGGTDAAVAVAPTRRLDEAFPKARRTRLKFRDGGYSGCNLFAFMTAQARAVPAFWARLDALRKKPAQMALSIGPMTLIGYVLRLWSLQGALDRLGRRVGATISPVVIDSARAATDVDSLDDLALVRELMEGGAPGKE